MSTYAWGPGLGGEMPKVECFFDCSSPWSYMGFSNLLTLTARLGLEVTWRPVVVGFIFERVNRDVYTQRRLMAPPLKAAYELKEMQDWADAAGLVIRVPPQCGHPINAVSCMRACIALEPTGKLVPFAFAAYEALWRDGRNLGDREVLADICHSIGVISGHLFAAIADDAVKTALKRNNDELARRGGFGVPTFYVEEEMFFGNNRMILVENALRTQMRNVKRSITSLPYPVLDGVADSSEGAAR